MYIFQTWIFIQFFLVFELGDLDQFYYISHLWFCEYFQAFCKHLNDDIIQNNIYNLTNMTHKSW